MPVPPVVTRPIPIAPMPSGPQPLRFVRFTAPPAEQPAPVHGAADTVSWALDACEPVPNSAGLWHRRLEEVREQVDANPPAEPPPAEPPRRARAGASSPYTPFFPSRLRQVQCAEVVAPPAPASLPRLAQVRALGASTTSLRWAPSPLPALPQLGVSLPHTPAISSPLRPYTEGAFGPMARLQLGDAIYQRGPDHIKTATNHWLHAFVEADRPAVAEVLEQRLARARRRPRAERALLSFHLAFFTPDVHLSRKTFVRAMELDPGLALAAEQVMMRAFEQPTMRELFESLCKRFAALLPQVAQLQQRLAELVRARDWAEVTPLAEFLGESLPHLLLPRCAELVAKVVAARNAGRGGEYPVLAAQARAVMSDVFALDGEGHVHASGRYVAADYAMLWGVFLEAWYIVEPTAFGATYDARGRLREPAIDRRMVAGLPWRRAMRMPFTGSWGQEYVAWRQEQDPGLI